MGPMRIDVTDEAIREHARRLLEAGTVPRSALALAFAETSAATAEVLVGGTSFYPPMLADIRAASSSVHINQFGFRPGIVGDEFAEVLVAKAAQGVPVRLVVDRNGSVSVRCSRDFFDLVFRGGVLVHTYPAKEFL